MKPIPVEQVQSKWDKEHMQEKVRRSRQEDEMEEFKPTSKAVNWSQVIRRSIFFKLSAFKSILKFRE